VLIAGGGVAALEAAVALTELAGERAAVTLLAPEREFLYRPMTVLEPFSGPLAGRWPLAQLASRIGVASCPQALSWIDPRARLAHTSQGEALAYDALLLAVGARRYARFRYATTIDDRRLDDQLHGLVEDVEQGYTRSVAFLVPSRVPWPLAVYELALMTAERALQMNVDVVVSIVTPERAPLEALGEQASRAVARRLQRCGVELHLDSRCEVIAPGRVRLGSGQRELVAARLIALPELAGPSIGGVPRSATGGFIRIDRRCAVVGLERVWAAGDAVDFPVKLGGLAAQQAEVAATAIAALAGAPLPVAPLQPHVEVVLLGGGAPLHLSAELIGRRPTHSRAETQPRWPATRKIAAPRLAVLLDALDGAPAR